MKRTQISLTLLLIVPCLIGAVDIVEEELESVSDAQIEFINYEGPHDIIETVDQIKSIGASLAIQPTETEAGEEQAEYALKYRILHIVAPPEAEGYNADLFIIEENAQVDHIDNVRRILSGYYEASYNMSAERAAALALFTTYYNAVYRGNMEFFRENYSSPVIDALDPQKVGIARRYNEWPGATQMVIPLTQLAGQDMPSAESLSTDEVVEDVRTREDRGVEERKEVVEMREEELEEDRRQLEEEREQEPDQPEPDAAEPSTDESAEEPSPETEDEPAEELSPETEDEPEAEPAAEVTEDETEDETDQREEELAQRERDIAEERESIAEDQQEMIEEEQRQEDRTAAEEEDAEQEEETQATDQPPSEAEAAETAPPTSPFALFRRQDNQLLGRLALLEPDGQIAARSTLNTIRSREPVDFGELYVAIAGEDNPPRAVRLVGLNQENLELEQQSETDIYPESPLLVIDNSLYCIIRDSGSYYIGKFDTQLQLQQQSDQPVLAYTWLQQSGEHLLAQGDTDSVQQYRTSDLKQE
ncbi:MAG: P83/100 family protein [Spirochaetia bacterium]